MGTAAFVLSLIAFFTAGLLAPIAFIMSLVALKDKPKDLAAAGLVISVVQLVGGFFVWTMFILPLFIGLATVAKHVSGENQVVTSSGPGKPSALVTGVKLTKGKTGGYTASMTIKNTSKSPISRIAVSIEMVDSNREVVAKDVFNASMRPLAPEESRLFELDVPRYSQLNAEMPDSCRPRVDILTVQ